MTLRKRRSSRKGPTLAALTIAGAGAGAVALMKRERLLGAIGRGEEADGVAPGPQDGVALGSQSTAPAGESPRVTRLPKPGIG